MSPSRQLAAIMFTDIQGYTKLMQQSEGQALRLREKHRLIFNSTTKKFGGKILQYYGDGTLSVFNSAIDAVLCACEMQIGFKKEPVVPVRIGIHTGDIIFNEEEIIGDGVNVASRIESLAIPGSVLISGKVFDEIKNQENINSSFLKSVLFKNVQKPIEIYAISNTGLNVPYSEEIEGKTAPIAAVKKSIAVLAFENMSADPEQEYFSDGISEEILNSLVKIEGLKVAGRTSSFSFKGKNEDIRTIGEKLDVSMVLEGSVRKAGNRVRVTAQLINAEDGYHFWSETYNRELDDIFAVQEDIANHIAEKFKLQGKKAATRKSQTQNAEAYELFLKGSYFFKKGYDNKTKAMEYFQKAVEMDPNYAEAHSCIAETYLHYAGLELLTTPEAYTKARNASNKALKINPHEPRAHLVTAYIHLFFDWNWEASLAEYNIALEYGLSQQNEFISYYYIFVEKKYDHAIHISEQLLKNDPLHAGSHWHLGLCNYFAQRFKTALESFNNALELNPESTEALHWKGITLGYLGEFEKAKEFLERAAQNWKIPILINFDMFVLKIQMGLKEEVLRTLEAEKFVDPINPASLYALLEMPEEAIFWLEKAYHQRNLFVVSLKHHWVWDPIRSHPGFIEIYNKMNF